MEPDQALSTCKIHLFVVNLNAVLRKYYRLNLQCTVEEQTIRATYFSIVNFPSWICLVSGLQIRTSKGKEKYAGVNIISLVEIILLNQLLYVILQESSFSEPINIIFDQG